MIFIDRNGLKIEPDIVSAILNGIEIDTSNQRADKKENSSTIDI